MQQKINDVRSFLEREGLSQAGLARRAKVSQASVSRALSGKQERHGGARQKLMDYIRATGATILPDTKAGEMSVEILGAVNQVWDRSRPHANAIARVIRALDGLTPKPPQKRR